MPTQLRSTLTLSLKAVSMAMAAITIALTALDYRDMSLLIILLSVGLFSHVLATIIESN
jgi:hypothetical protein